MTDEQAIKNEIHAKDPKIGDYWNECFHPVCVVVDVSDFAVTVCDSTKDVGKNKWTWDISKLSVCSREEFSTKYRYEHIDGYTCDVYPEIHKWAREAIEMTT